MGLFDCLNPKTIFFSLLIVSLICFSFVAKVTAEVPGCNGEVMYCVKDCTYGFRPEFNVCCTARQYANHEVICVQAPMVVSGPLDCNSVGCANGLYLSCASDERMVNERGYGKCQMLDCPAGYHRDPTGACVADEVPPVIVSTTFGCNSCTPQYEPTGCDPSASPGDPDYDPACHVSSYDCHGYPVSAYCGGAWNYCIPDISCTGGADGLGVNNYTDRICLPIISGFGLVSGTEQRFCNNQCGQFPAPPPPDGIEDPCRVGVNADVACTITRVGSNRG